ncbi:MAG: CHAT domain-containing protein, partial [Bacteroidota bacterium]
LSWYEQATATSESMGYGQKSPFQDISSAEDLDGDYRNSVRLLCALGDIQTAFETAERAKVRTDFNLITVSQRRIAGLMSDSSRARIMRIRSELEQKHAKLASESQKRFPENDGEAELGILSDIANLEVEYRKLLDSAKVRDPGYYNLLNPTVMSVGYLQTGILGPDQAILEYAVGEEQTEAFLVKLDTLLHFTIDRTRADLSSLVGRTSLLFNEEAQGLQIWNPVLANFDVMSCRELYRLLVEPIADQLQDVRHIFVVPDDVLKRVPFGVLVTEVPDDTDHVGFQDVKFLIDGFELSYAPSASILDPRFKVVKRPRKLLLALGNPTLSEVRQNSGIEILPVTLRHTMSLPILPGAEKEVSLINRVFDNRADLFVGDEASKTLFKQLAPQYKILHVAAHASADNVRPLHSSIYLAVDPESDDDGVLRAFEFFNLELNADLAVLSACNTGRVRDGQGLEGLVRGLVFAGVPSVVATLWVVEDEATAMLMERFYSYLKQGERKSRALQMAKLDLIRSGKSDPFYWAGFILIGDASPIDFSDIDSTREWTWVAVLSLMVALIEVIVYRKVVTE